MNFRGVLAAYQNNAALASGIDKQSVYELPDAEMDTLEAKIATLQEAIATLEQEEISSDTRCKNEDEDEGVTQGDSSSEDEDGDTTDGSDSSISYARDDAADEQKLHSENNMKTAAGWSKAFLTWSFLSVSAVVFVVGYVNMFVRTIEWLGDPVQFRISDRTMRGCLCAPFSYNGDTQIGEGCCAVSEDDMSFSIREEVIKQAASRGQTGTGGAT